MNNLIIFGVCIIILVVIVKCVILIRYLSKITKKNHNKYQKSILIIQLKKDDCESSIYNVLNE